MTEGIDPRVGAVLEELRMSLFLEAFYATPEYQAEVLADALQLLEDERR